ncbi:hypothetical protein [Pseudonocardia pini]|uniref:hypothetical protein n=1 Tax=Pseudonocardia pini TaxID=2758030 RepID=UPI0015F0C8E3|nr:hypothetical protein [Pseudonocardia pini]
MTVRSWVPLTGLLLGFLALVAGAFTLYGWEVAAFWGGLALIGVSLLVYLSRPVPAVPAHGRRRSPLDGS